MFTLKISKSLFHFLGVCSLVFTALSACNGIDLSGSAGSQGEQAGQGEEVNTQPEVDLVAVEAQLLVFVSPGEFNMGSTDEDLNAGDDEFPLHTVRLPGFLIHGHEVTNSFYQQCVEDGDCTPPTISDDGPSKFYDDPNYGDNPVVGVDWFQAKAYCEYVDMRLPTEAEWEYAARSDTGFLYPWGDSQPTEELANTSGINNDRFPEEPQTDDVDLRPDGESEYELRDMAGNVMEWVADWYDPNYYEVSPSVNPQGPGDDEGLTEKVVRGGGWNSTPEDARSADRFALDPLTTREDLGFRCIPKGQNRAMAPFCVETGTPFCVPRGGDTPGDEDCEPVAPPTINRIAAGCPNDDGTITVILDTDASPDEVGATFYGNDFNCVEDGGVLICTGPRPPTNANINFTMCVGANGQTGNHNGNGLVAFVPQTAKPAGNSLVTFDAAPSAPSAAPLVTFDDYQSETDPNDLDVYCGEYETFNTSTGQCERTDDGCPQGTTWTEFGCTPDDGGNECGDWDYNLETGYCEPPGGGDEGLCAEGYFFDESINCCNYIPEDNFGCEEGYYYNYEYDRCWPTTDEGCEPGYVFDYEQGCVPGDDGGQNGEIPGQTTIPTDDDGCPPFTGLASFDNRTCEPTGDDNKDQTTDDGYDYGVSQTEPPCHEGQVRNANGVCETPDDGSDEYDRCSEIGGVYVDGQCYTDDDGCGPGYYMDTLTEQCIPTGGQCNPGSVYNSEYECCTPDNYCPGGEDDFQSEIPGTTTLTAYDPGYPNGYNPESGFCDPGDDGECLPGYIFDTSQNTCVPTDDGGQPDCGPNGYWDTSSETCVPYDDDGCEVGEYDTGQGCVPYDDYDTSNGNCPLGYYYDTSQEGCVPGETTVPGVPGQTTSTTSSCDEGCTTVTVYVDACETPQDFDPCADVPGTRYDDVTDSCVPRDNEVCEEVCTAGYFDTSSNRYVCTAYETVCK
ncbi:MAG: formylglycine-generating enzyme family protein [Chloroflexi bacterium]|nr:MAG: formylglycine-generating enzyme family protein [Chloroflexota bacterium]MBL1195783.1 formylglycine-generating enzyme family protein [Chloroflexota bacterium]NOH13074.1 formylglycine-generating enzyme family protein [Chloroflexota bacterium]